MQIEDKPGEGGPIIHILAAGTKYSPSSSPAGRRQAGAFQWPDNPPDRPVCHTTNYSGNPEPILT